MEKATVERFPFEELLTFQTENQEEGEGGGTSSPLPSVVYLGP